MYLLTRNDKWQLQPGLYRKVMAEVLIAFMVSLPKFQISVWVPAPWTRKIGVNTPNWNHRTSSWWYCSETYWSFGRKKPQHIGFWIRWWMSRDLSLGSYGTSVCGWQHNAVIGVRTAGIKPLHTCLSDLNNSAALQKAKIQATLLTNIICLWHYWDSIQPQR